MKVPIQNIYYLLCYAWDKLEEGSAVDVSADDTADLQSLFARVLVSGTEHLLKRGLDRGYVTNSEDTARPRGRIDFPASVSMGSLSAGKLHCHSDELSYDILHNRILKTTLRSLATADGLDARLRQPLLGLYRRMDAVGETRITTGLFRRVQLHRNNRYYGLLMHVCQLVHESLLIDSETGMRTFSDFTRDEEKMRALFESFIRNFCIRHFGQHCTISAKYLDWQETAGTDEDLAYVPRMRTDITMQCGARTLIIDTKYYRDAFDRPFGVERLKADNLYQIVMYVENRARSADGQHVEGMLLYPSVHRSFDIRPTLLGHPIRATSIDLAQHWSAIESDLTALVSSHFPELRA